MIEHSPEYQKCLDSAPELLCLESSDRNYELTAKLKGGDNITRKIQANINALIDRSSGDFWRIIRVDDFPFKVEKITVNVIKKRIAINLVAITHI